MNIQCLIIQGNTFNYEDELSLISDILKFNILDYHETSKFYLYGKAAIISVEMKSAHGAHERRHTAGDSDATNRISHATFISTNHLIKGTIQLLEKDGLKQGVDLKVP